MKRLLSRLSVACLVVLVAACTAKQVGDVGELPPPPLPPSSPSLQTATPYAAPAPVAGGAPARVAQAPEPRIDELYPGSGAMIGAGGGAPGRSAVGDITLDFQDTDLREVVRVILGDLLNLNYVIDPDVGGRVTMSTARPLSTAALGAILAAQGAHIVNYGDIYRITRVTDVAQLAGAGIDVGTSGLAGSAGLRVLPLAFIDGDEMAKILEPLLPEGAIVYTDAKRGLLIVGGSSAELALAAETVEIFDIDQMAGQTVMLISLQHADAKVVAAEVDGIVRAGGDTAEPGNLVQLIPIERLNAIMIIARQVAYVEQARAWVFRLDRARSPTEKRMYVYYVQHSRAGSLADALRDALGGAGGGAVPVASVADTSSAIAAEPLPAAYSGGLPEAEAGPASAAAIFGTQLRIAVDEEHNALLISATPQEFELIEEVIARLDIRPLQVMIETSIFEVTLQDTLRYGIQYAVSNDGLGITDDGQITLSSDTLVATTVSGVVTPIIQPFLPGFSFSLDDTDQTRLIVDALSALTEVNMISSPNVLVHNNKTAQLRVGDEVPIVTQTTTSTVTDDPLIVNAVQYRSTGVNLEVTPRVNASGTITLEIYQEISDVVATDTSGIDSPTIQNRVLISTISMQSGDTIMLGGLIRERAFDSKSGIPILHELPIIGAMFGQTNTTSQRVELVVLIRPVIIATPGDARAVTADLRRKFLTLLQREQTGVRQPRRMVSEDLQ